MQTNVILSE